MERNLITLAMPIYNVENYIEKALFSALNQTYDNIEYILVDDKGTDKSMDMVRNIISSHRRKANVKIIEHQQNIGLGATRNTAIDAATGKYIFFMDSDDEISLDCIEKLHAQMQAEDVDLVIGSYKRVLRTGETIEECICNNPSIHKHQDIVWNFFEKRNKFIPVTTWNKLYNVSFLRDKQIYCIPHHLNEDTVFSFQVFLNANSCAFVQDITYYYYDTPNSIVNADISYRIGVGFTEISDFWWNYAQNYNRESVYESILSYICLKTFYRYARTCESRLLSRTEKKEILKKLSFFPLSFREIMRLKRKRLFLLVCKFAFALPFRSTLIGICWTLIKLGRK